MEEPYVIRIALIATLPIALITSFQPSLKGVIFPYPSSENTFLQYSVLHIVTYNKICWMLLSNQIFELESHETVEVVMGMAVGC